MTQLNCVIADDEKLARDLLINYVNRLPNCRLAGVFGDGITLLEFLKGNRADILLLDIEMPQLTGIEVIRSLERSPAIILTTAYSQYAVEAFELCATDYLRKPFSFERFVKAIDKAGQKICMSSEEKIKFIDISVDRQKVRIPIDQIVYIEAVGNYIKVHLRERFLVTYSSIQKIQSTLPSSEFVRIHRSFIVNMNHIHSYGASSLKIGEERTLPIGRSFSKKLKAFNQANNK
jgi:DNA-binding LytR/AlgR family response regulator